MATAAHGGAAEGRSPAKGLQKCLAAGGCVFLRALFWLQKEAWLCLSERGADGGPALLKEELVSVPGG